MDQIGVANLLGFRFPLLMLEIMIRYLTSLNYTKKLNDLKRHVNKSTHPPKAYIEHV